MTNLPPSSIVSVILFFPLLLIHLKLSDSLRDKALTPPPPLCLVFIWFIVSSSSSVIFYCSPNKSAYRSSRPRRCPAHTFRKTPNWKISRVVVKHIDAKSTDMGGNRPRAADLSSVLPPNPCFIKIFTILSLFVQTLLNIGSSKWKIKEQQIPHPPLPPLGHDWLSSQCNSKRDFRSDNELEWLSCRPLPQALQRPLFH